MNHYKYYKNYFENNMRIMYLLRTELVKHSRLVFIFNNSSTSKLNSNLWAWFSDFWFKPLKDAITTATLQITLACHAMSHCCTGPQRSWSPRVATRLREDPFFETVLQRDDWSLQSLSIFIFTEIARIGGKIMTLELN